MRPEWFKCENCLFFEPQEAKTDKKYCMLNASEDLVWMSMSWFCSKWTCRNCWRTWDIEEYLDIDKDKSFEMVFIDHTKCQEVKFK